MKAKTVTLVCSDMDASPMGMLSAHDGYCETDKEVVEAMKELRDFGHRFAGMYRITVEKVPSPIVQRIRKLSKEIQDA